MSTDKHGLQKFIDDSFSENNKDDILITCFEFLIRANEHFREKNKNDKLGFSIDYKSTITGKYYTITLSEITVQ